MTTAAPFPPEPAEPTSTQTAHADVVDSDTEPLLEIDRKARTALIVPALERSRERFAEIATLFPSIYAELVEVPNDLSRDLVSELTPAPRRGYEEISRWWICTNWPRCAVLPPFLGVTPVDKPCSRRISLFDTADTSLVGSWVPLRALKAEFEVVANVLFDAAALLETPLSRTCWRRWPGPVGQLAYVWPLVVFELHWWDWPGLTAGVEPKVSSGWITTDLRVYDPTAALDPVDANWRELARADELPWPIVWYSRIDHFPDACVRVCDAVLTLLRDAKPRQEPQESPRVVEARQSKELLVMEYLKFHHEPDDTRCELRNPTPVVAAEVAQRLQVNPSTVSRFFQRHFEKLKRDSEETGYAAYRRLCGTEKGRRTLWRMFRKWQDEGMGPDVAVDPKDLDQWDTRSGE